METTNPSAHRILIHLSLIKNIGPSTVFKVLKHLFLKQYPDLIHVGWMELIDHKHELDFDSLYTYSTGDFIRQVGLADAVALLLTQGLNDKTLLEQELERAARNNISICSFFDVEYPEILRQIHTPPLVLYYQGTLFNTMAKRIAIVGARKASSYAAHVMQSLVPDLVTQGWHIVSGGAHGADTMAHEATLAAGGRTIAVIGSGLLQPYPTSNKDLFKRIIDAGGIITSPFPLLLPPDKGTFPARNRIIAGLSLGCVVVQAAQKSGALITAKYALEQGRIVFAVPGPIDQELSIGCNNLIKEGAKLVNHANDILEEFGETSVVSATFVQKTETIVEERVGGAQRVIEPIDPLLSLLVKPATLDELLIKSGMNADELQDKLFTLQLEGKVRQNFAGTWELVQS